jgi:hypothetical protein
MLAGEFGPLNPRQDDYPRFLVGSCRNWQRDRRGAFETYRAILDERTWTITQDRAAFTAGNISWYVPDEKVICEGLEILRRAASAGRANPYVHRARLVLGVRLMKLGRVREGAAWLARVPKSASGYFSVAQEYLGALEEAVRDAKTKKPRLDRKPTGPANKGANAGERS